MINVIASIHVKEGRLPEFIEIFKSNISKVLKEKGCLAYTPTVDFATGFPPQVLDKQVVTIIEKWENLENLKTHLVSPHMREYEEKVKDIVENVSLKVLKEA